MSDALCETAESRAKAISGSSEPTIAPLQRLVNSGVYARFALEADIITPTAEEAYTELFSNPLHAGILQHNGVTHIGFGLWVSGGKAHLVVDLARIVEPVDTTQTANSLLEQINRNRARIGVAPLKQEPKLSNAATSLIDRFRQSTQDSEALVAEAKAEISKKNIALGKITIAFQTAGTLDELELPERTSAPNAEFVGISVAQGNYESQDAGAIVMALILATPQQTATSQQDRKLPPPKAMPSGHKTNTNASLEEQAWLATLVGNHKKAAALFEKAYRRTKEARFLYECARAYARNDERQKALEKMKQFAAICPDDQKQSADEMVKKLQKGESIFDSSKAALSSVEAKRFFILGQKLFTDGQWEGAIDAFSQAYAYSPHPDLIYNMGLAHLKNGDVGEALDFFQEYQRQVPEAQNAEQAKQLFHMGVELYNVGQYEAAAKRFTMAYSALPIEEILYNLALCHEAMNDTNEALRIFQELADKTTDPARKKEYKKMIKNLKP
ncbi:MAG: tetratricopeptide repeat protein [Deltaproteobacteria bacterium]|nr:tetratricopeptide repeat protein [Deltaproteobacteria bacterium]MBN2674692.1 tetratricopeptide repeat protein [Deltaproteobacteria bacterium]